MPTIKDVSVTKPSQAQKEQAAKWQTWSCGASEFEWFYTQTEKCLILEGKATVYSTDKSESLSFGEGDFVVFPEELECIWKVHEPIKKHFDFE